MAHGTSSAASVPSAATIFDSDRVLLYNVQPWASLGFGVPNFGSNIGTQSEPTWRLVDEIGRVQLFIMTHVDARRPQYPSTNTVQRLAKLINRVQSILAGRQRYPNDPRLEPGKAGQNPSVWNVHPVPFFDGPMVRNPWLKEYNKLIMVALTNAMRHPDNQLSLTITSDFAQQVWQWIKEVKILMCTELLGMTLAQANDDTQLVPGGPYNGPGSLVQPGSSGIAGAGSAPAAGVAATQPTYNPPASVINMDAIINPGPLFSGPTSDDLQPLLSGIPANLLIPNLAQYPVGPIPGEDALGGEATPFDQALIGVGATDGPGGAMGSPAGVTVAAKAILDAVNANIGPAPGNPSSPATPTGAGQAAGGVAPVGTISPPSV